MPPGIALAVAYVAAGAFCGAMGLRRGPRRLALLLACGVVLLTPLLISPERRTSRFLASVLAIALSVKLYDVHLGIELGFRPAARSFLLSLPNIGALVLRKLAYEPRPSRSEILTRLARQCPAFILGAAALAGAFRIDWRHQPFALEHGTKVVAFFLMLVPGAAVAASAWRLLGGRSREPMTNPFAARTPADFWRRYNRPAQQFLHEDVFKPLGGLRSPVRATLATFLVSAIIHEYVFDIAVGRVQGYQAAFFAVQGIAVAATLGIRPAGRSAFPWVVGTFAFNLATSMLFFASLGEVLPFYAR